MESVVSRARAQYEKLAFHALFGPVAAPGLDPRARPKRQSADPGIALLCRRVASDHRRQGPPRLVRPPRTAAAATRPSSTSSPWGWSPNSSRWWTTTPPSLNPGAVRPPLTIRHPRGRPSPRNPHHLRPRHEEGELPRARHAPATHPPLPGDRHPALRPRRRRRPLFPPHLNLEPGQAVQGPVSNGKKAVCRKDGGPAARGRKDPRRRRSRRSATSCSLQRRPLSPLRPSLHLGHRRPPPHPRPDPLPPPRRHRHHHPPTRKSRVAAILRFAGRRLRLPRPRTASPPPDSLPGR